MSDTMIQVQNLSKRYRIGAKEAGYKTFREAIIDSLKSPLHNFRRLRKLTRFDDGPSKEKGAKRIAHSAKGNSLLYAPGPMPSSADSEDIIWAVRDVSFEVKQGEVLGIIGHNGAGKSTVLKILSRITEPTAGDVMLYGRVSSLLEVGTGFHPELTGRENIFLNGAILGMRKTEIDRKFDEIVDFSEIDRFIDTPVKRYSSGMFVRLAFAVAAHLEPEILLVDEVLAVGDATFQKKCLGKMGEVAHEGRTVLFVSHNMGTIQRLCSKVIWMEKGAIKESGEAHEICEKYLQSDIRANSGCYTFPDGAGHDMRFLKAELINSRGVVMGTFRQDEPIKFRITYHVAQDIEGGSLGLVIYNTLGIPLWAVGDWDFCPELNKKRSAGTWYFEAVAPAGVLRPGRYMVTLEAGSGGQYYHHPAQFPFEITTDGFWRKGLCYPAQVGGAIVLPMEVSSPIKCEI